jgi:hypothetical protein
MIAVLGLKQFRLQRMDEGQPFSYDFGARAANGSVEPGDGSSDSGTTQGSGKS